MQINQEVPTLFPKLIVMRDKKYSEQTQDKERYFPAQIYCYHWDLGGFQGICEEGWRWSMRDKAFARTDKESHE